SRPAKPVDGDRRTLGRDHRQELTDVDPRLQASDRARAGRLARTSHDRAARIPRGEGDGDLAGLHRGTEGVFGEARAEVAGTVSPSPSLRAKRSNPGPHMEPWIASSLRSSQ